MSKSITAWLTGFLIMGKIEISQDYQESEYMANFIKLEVFCYIGKHSKTLAFL